MPDGQIYSFNESRLDVVGETMGFEDSFEHLAFAAYHARDGEGELALFFALNELSIMQIFINLPMIFASAWWSEPVAKMCRNGIKVGAQSITYSVGTLISNCRLSDQSRRQNGAVRPDEPVVW